VSAGERARYWLDRLVRGPEPSVEASFSIPDFHQGLLDDAIAALVRVPGPALDLLAEPALVARLTTSEDSNPWYAILDVLGAIGARRPEVARAWAVPALSHPIVTLRRRALPILASLRDPADAPLLLEVVRGNAADRSLAPGALEALVRLGPPWDAKGLRAAFERGGADLWNRVPDLVTRALPEGAARGDLLAWWACLAGGAGPLATPGTDLAGNAVLAPDPAAGPVVGPEHAKTTGQGPAALARAALAGAGHAAYVDALAADLDAGDPAAADRALLLLAAAGDGRALRRARARLATGLAEIAAPPAERGAPSDAEVAALLGALRADASEETTTLLRRTYDEARPSSAYESSRYEAFSILSRRGVDRVPSVEAALRGDDPGEAAFGVVVVRRSRDPAFRPVVRALLRDAPEGPRRHSLRSLRLWLETGALAKGGTPVEELAAFAREVAGWVEEGRGGEGFATGLLELGPPGQALFAEGLRGPRRATYVRILAETRGTVPASVIEALLAPLGPETPEAERRQALVAAFKTAPEAAAVHLAALARRTRPAARPEVERVLRIVRHRTPAPGP
jgi:hypothetical protein